MYDLLQTPLDTLRPPKSRRSAPILPWVLEYPQQAAPFEYNDTIVVRFLCLGQMSAGVHSQTQLSDRFRLVTSITFPPARNIGMAMQTILEAARRALRGDSLEHPKGAAS